MQNTSTTGSIISTSVYFERADTSAQSDITSIAGQSSSVFTATTDHTNESYRNDGEKNQISRSHVTSELSTASVIEIKSKTDARTPRSSSRLITNASRKIPSATDTDGEQPQITSKRSLFAKVPSSGWKHRSNTPQRESQKPLEFDDEPKSVQNATPIHGRSKPIIRPRCELINHLHSQIK